MEDSVELEIRIAGAEGRRHRASVARGPSQVGGNAYFDLPEGGFMAGSGEWRDLRRKAETSDTALFRLLTEQGRALFELVFAGDLYAAFLRSYELARSEGKWFRLQFSFDHAPMAMDQPWEALVSREGNALALLPAVSIERRLITAPTLEMPRLPEGGRLRALVAGASPQNLGPIDVKAERRLIRNELGKPVEIQTLEHTSLSSLGKVLAADGAAFDLIHFIGHGDFEADEGGLWLEDERGDGVRLTGPILPPALRRPVSFVFLNICHGGRSSLNPFAGIAEALLRSGVRAVVAMRREISDPGAVALAKNFYKCLARGESLTRAIAKARGNVVNTHYGDWAVPMLYLAGEDFALLPAPASPLPIAQRIGPRLDSEETPAPGDGGNEPSLRRLFGPAGSRWTAKRAIALGLAFLVAATFGLWFGWPTADLAPATPTGAEEAAPPPPQPLVGRALETAGEPSAAASEAPKPVDAAPAAMEKKLPVVPPAPAPSADVPAKPSPADENARRCPSPPGIPIDFILVRAGKTFRQGEDRGESDFGPQHEVTLTRDYCLAKFETTRGLWARVHGWAAPPIAEAKLPRSYVTKEETLAFLGILNQVDRAGEYRLPTEAEWEYAARAGTATHFSFGDDKSKLPLYGNCLHDDRPQRATPVGSLEANPWGFHDLHGNVWEWVRDDWTAYSAEAAVDPLGANPRANPVRRGSAYDSKAENCWSAARKDLGVSQMKTVGFRIVRTPVR